MKSRKILILVVMAVIAVMLTGQNVLSAEKPTIAGGCKRCHTAEDKAVRGTMGPVSEGLKTIQVKVGKLIWVIKYDDKTTVIKGEEKAGADEIAKISANKEILVSYFGDAPNLMASEIAIKQPYKISEEQKITNEEVVSLVAQGPDKGNYTLIDSRPLGVYLDGHIPTAKSLPFESFDTKAAKVLPADKGRLLIFYCGGPT